MFKSAEISNQKVKRIVTREMHRLWPIMSRVGKAGSISSFELESFQDFLIADKIYN